MVRRSSENSSWGGKREGAGRQKSRNAYDAQVAVRIPKETAAACKALGGASFLRDVIEEAVSRRQKAAVSQTETVPSKSLGFDAISTDQISFPSGTDEPKVSFVDMRVNCGFPSPAMDYATDKLSLSELMIRNELATFFAVATGDSMADAGIEEGDTLILDRSIEPRSGDVVLAYLGGEFTLKRLRIENGVVSLHPENESADYPVIRPTEFDDFSVEGVLTGICRRFRK